MDFVRFRPDESQSTLPGDVLLSSKNTKINAILKIIYIIKKLASQNNHKTKPKP